MANMINNIVWSTHTAAWQKQIKSLTDEHGMAIDDCILCDPVGKLGKNGKWQNRWLCLAEGGICRSTGKMGKGKNPFFSFSDIDGFDTKADPNVFVVRAKNGKELIYKVLVGDSVPKSHHSRDDWISRLRQVSVALVAALI